MGHVLLGVLPNTRPWRKLVGMLESGADTATIADATMHAAERGLDLAKGDEGLSHTLWLLTQITLAAREEDFAAALNRAGLPVPADPGVFDLVGKFTEAVDEHLHRTRSRTDIGEMAQLAAVESLTALCRERSETLYGVTPEEVKSAVRSFSTKKGFSVLAHDFFARLTQRFLTYHLSRELSNHVGEDRRFANCHEHTEFLDQLRVHCQQAAIIVRDFSGGWYSKTEYETGITPKKAEGFARKALDKLRKELKRRGAADAP